MELANIGVSNLNSGVSISKFNLHAILTAGLGAVWQGAREVQ